VHILLYVRRARHGACLLYVRLYKLLIGLRPEPASGWLLVVSVAAGKGLLLLCCCCCCGRASDSGRC
jgi:hypothetical protein